MSKSKKEPIKKGVCKVPVVMQLEALECGAASLAMVLAYYGKWIPLEQVRRDCGVSRDGSNAKNVLKAARHYGLNAKGYRFEPEALKANGTFPCIIHWNFNHFVVLDGFRGDKAYLNDPARGAYSVSMDIFDESFTGICLMFSPGESFEPSGAPKKMSTFAFKRLRGAGTALAFAVITSVILSLLQFITPGFSRVFLDYLLPGKKPAWVKPVFVLWGAVFALEVIMTALQGIYDLRISGKMAAAGNASYMWKILRMPMEFFSQRMAGDIQQRQSTNASIAYVLINTFAPLLLNAVMMLIYFVAMIRYSPILTLVGVSSIGINALLSAYISKKRVNITRVAMRDEAKLSSATVAGIEMIETIKASGAENGYFSKWSGYQASVNTQKIRYAQLNAYLGMIPLFINSLADYAVLVLGIYLTMQGRFSAGMILAFEGFLLAFMDPATQLIDAGQTLQEMRTQMERIDDVMDYPDDEILPEMPLSDDIEYDKLRGEVELKNVSFGYAPLGQPLVRDFNLKLEPGKSVAIVGGSGCGKSTISKLISGLYRPWSGEILFDGKPISEIDKSVFRASLAVVDQDIILFEDSISKNIKMWDDSIEDFEVIMAARDAQIHEDIMQRRGGYDYKLIEGGKDFSGGQRQRLEIARVLAQDPTIIIMDEATSALDARTEYEVVKAIRERGITCIVVAHRLSTIRSCDEILVMEKGVVVDRGTHKELIEKSGLYHDLVASE